MYTIYLTTPSDVHGPSDVHSLATGRTLAVALQRARVRLDTYGPVSAGRLFYCRPGDGTRRPLIGA